MEPDDLPCPRNARLKKALVGRAQWEINQPPSLKRSRASLEGSSITSLDGRSRTKHGVSFRERETSERGREVERQLGWSPCSQSPHDKVVVT